MRTRLLVACLVGALLLSASTVNAEVRTWTRNDGKTVEASYVSLNPRTTDAGQNIYIVTLKKADGTQVTLRAGMLCKVDRAYLVQILKSQHKPVPAVLLKDPPPRPAPATAVAQAVVVVNSNPQSVSSSPVVQPNSAQPKPVQPVVDAAKPAKPNPPPAPKDPVVQPKSPTSEPLVVVVRPQDDMDKGKGRKKSVDSDALQDRIEQMKTAKALLRRILKGFPANCVAAEVVGTPKPVKEDDQKVTVRVKVKLSVDEKALATFRKRLLVVLDEFQEEGWEETWKFERLKGRSSESARKSAAQADAEYARVKEKGGVKEGGKTDTDEIVVYVNTERNEDWTSLKWKAYALDQMLTGVFDDATGRHGECVLSIFSKAGDTIPLDRFPLDDARLGGTTPIADRADYGGGKTLFISSTFLRDSACTKHAPSVTVVRDVEIDASLLDRLQALKCETRYVSSERRGK